MKFNASMLGSIIMMLGLVGIINTLFLGMFKDVIDKGVLFLIVIFTNMTLSGLMASTFEE